MAKGYSTDLRERVVAIVDSGESAREAARLLDLGASTAIRWIERWTTTGSVAAKPGTGHIRSPLEQHKQWLIDLVCAEPDLTLAEIRTRLAREKKLKAGTTSIWRFYERHGSRQYGLTDDRPPSLDCHSTTHRERTHDKA